MVFWGGLTNSCEKRSEKQRRREIYTHLNATFKEWQGEIRKPSSVISTKKLRKIIEWERLEISSGKLEIPRKHFMKKKDSEATQSCPTLCNPMDCSLPAFSVHGIFQAKVLECVVISFSRGAFRPRDQTWVSHIAGKCFTIWATREDISCKDGHNKGQKWQEPNRSKRDLEEVTRIHRRTIKMIHITTMVWSFT